MKRRLHQKIGRMLAYEIEFPQECFGNIPTVEMKGKNDAVVSGCRGILEYDACRVVLDAGSFRITVCGCGLTLVDFLSGSVFISGNIDSVAFSEGI